MGISRDIVPVCACVCCKTSLFGRTSSVKTARSVFDHRHIDISPVSPRLIATAQWLTVQACPCKQ